MIGRTTGVIAIVTLAAGCAQLNDFTVQPQPTITFTQPPIGTDSTTDVAPSPLPTQPISEQP